jgi:two-component system KDP operon response regulator KdpE
MRSETVLIVDDEPQIRRAVRNALREVVGRILEAGTGQQGIDLAVAEKPSLIVLDLGLPDRQGIDVCTELRRWSNAPIVVLSARHSDQEKASLLDSGADDYITKPFSTIELAARIRAHLRRAQTAAETASTASDAAGNRIDLGHLVVDIGARKVLRDGEPLHLTPIEWDLLRAFLAQAGRTLTHRQLFHAVWGRTFGDPQQYLRVHVANLRRKIEHDAVRPRLILTEPGVGYRFEIPG